jgi:hypothetical protein
MIKLTLISLLFPVALFAQDMKGSIGVVTISDIYGDTDHKIQFLNEDGTTWYTLDLYEDWKRKDDFQIMGFKPDYFLFYIRCIEKTATRFKVVVNEETGLIKFLPNSSKLKLQTWEEYVMNVFSIDFNSSYVKIYDRIGGTPLKEILESHKIKIPKEIKGEWMRIIWSDTEEYPSDTSEIRTGWIKWKEGNKIIVTIYHLS